MKKYIKYFLYNLAKFLHYIIQPHILMYLLLLIKKIPIIKKMVNFFDPNDIRKFTRYDLPEREIMIPNKKYNLLVNPRDHIGFNSFINNEPFEMSVYNLVERIKSINKKIIIDIGANIGTASIPICAKYGYELLAIEASKGNAKLLVKNILNNQIKSKLLLYALVDESYREEYVNMFINRGNTGANSLIESWNPSKNRKLSDCIEIVPTKTFDNIIKETALDINNILCVKIDVEGMEETVLQGSKKFLKINSAPIIMEYRNDALSKYTNKNMDGIVGLLHQSNYKLFSLSKNAKLGKFDKSKFYENIVALKEGSEFSQILK